MEKLNWGYIQEILEQATHGGTGCSPELFVEAYEAQQTLDAQIIELAQNDRDLEAARENIEKFHKHSAILSDLGFIEIWSPNEAALRGADGVWIDGDVFWPKRVTASGYMFLENLNEDEKHGGKVRGLLEDLGVRAARMLGNETIEQVFDRLPWG